MLTPEMRRNNTMHRREILTVFGAAATGLAFANEASAQHEGHHHPHDKVHEDCLNACATCKRECDEMFHHCFTELAAGKKEHAKALHLANDCAAFCDLSATMIARQSPLMAHACLACAEACKACAAECDRFDSPQMKECAAACRTCERTCREMMRSMGSGAR